MRSSSLFYTLSLSTLFFSISFAFPLLPSSPSSSFRLFSSNGPIYPNANARGLSTTPTSCRPLITDTLSLYVMPSPLDKTQPGPCPYAHYVRSVLTAKNIPYNLRPTPRDSKPKWLTEHYGGSLPALRHGAEAYVESDVIAMYLDFFFESPDLSSAENVASREKEVLAASASVGFMGKLKGVVVDGGDVAKVELLEALSTIDEAVERGGEGKVKYLAGGDGPTLADFKLAPMVSGEGGRKKGREGGKKMLYELLRA